MKKNTFENYRQYMDKYTENYFTKGIRIVNKMDISVPVSRDITGRIFLIITALLGSLGTVRSFFSMYDIPIENSTVNFYTLLFFVMFCTVSMLPGKFKLILFGMLGMLLITVYTKWEEFSQGFRLVFNCIYKQIYKFTGDYYAVRNPHEDSIEIFLACCLFCVVGGICIAVCDKPNFAAGFIFSFPVIEIGFFFGKPPSIIWGLMVFTYWIILIILNSCGFYHSYKRKNAGFTRRGDTFTAKPILRFHLAASCAAIAICICACIFLLTYIISNAAGYKRPEKLDQLRSDLKSAAAEFSFDDIGESLQKISASLGLNDDYKIYSQKLGQTGTVNFKHTTDLTVNFDTLPNSTLYLKGYTGGIYNGEEWLPMTDKTYSQNSELFGYFEENNTYPQLMTGKYVSNRFNSGTITAQITSKYKNEKYNYIPYCAFDDDKATADKDNSLVYDSKSSYKVTFSDMIISVDNLRDILMGLDYSINSDMDNYTDFVYTNYLPVPDTDAIQSIYNDFVEDTILSRQEDIYKKLEYIRTLLDDTCEYTLTPGRTPDSEDFAEYFLTGSHKGYCVHFATAGVLLARMSGIPARYATGYVANTTDLLNGVKQPDGSYNVSIRDERAHAWAEIYFSGLGWVPYEFTPASSAALANTIQQQKTTTKSETTTSTTNTTISRTAKGEGTNTSDGGSSSGAVKQSVTSGSTKVSSQAAPSRLSVKAKVIMMLAVLILAVVAVIIARHIITVRNRRKVLTEGAVNERVTFAYNCTEELLKCVEIKRENAQFLDFSRQTDARHSDVTDGLFTNLTETMLKAQMSNEPMTHEEGEQAVSIYKNIREKIYKMSNPVKGFIMRFIKNM